MKKKKFPVKRIAFIMFLNFFIFGMAYLYTSYQHELGHTKLCEYTGGQVEYFSIFGGVSCSNTDPSNEKDMMLINGLYEEITYPFQSLVFLMIILSMCSMCYMEITRVEILQKKNSDKRCTAKYYSNYKNP